MGGYTAGESEAFYRALYACAAAHQCFCWVSGDRGVIGYAGGSVPLVLTRGRLRADLVERGILAEEAFQRILTDFIYDGSLGKRSDIFFQPLLPVATDTFLLSPMVVTASSWERNLQRLWALKYSSQYAGVIGGAKDRLADELAARFRSFGFLASANRVLRVEGGPALTDSDLAVYDPRDGLLVLAHLKWFIASAESYEVRSADREVASGITQARKTAQFVSDHPDQAARLLFPGEAVSFPTPIRSQPIVIVRGHLPTLAVRAADVPSVGYEILATYLQQLRLGVPLNQVITDLVTFLERIEINTHYQLAEMALTLAGYNFTFMEFNITPAALFVADRLRRQVAKVGRNAPCPCGSGLKYKRCHG